MSLRIPRRVKRFWFVSPRRLRPMRHRGQWKLVRRWQMRLGRLAQRALDTGVYP